MNTTTEITYGPEYAARLTEVLGAPARNLPVVDTCIYLRPAYTAYALADGQIAKVVQRSFSDVVITYPDMESYRAAKDAWFGAMGDPETGRRS